MDSNKRTARIAGALYLALILFGIFAEFFVRAKLVTSGDAATTIQNIKDAQRLFRLGFVFDLIMLLAYFFLPLALYALLKAVNKNMAGVMVLSVIVAVAIMFVNMLHYYMAIMVADDATYLKVFDADERNALGMLFEKKSIPKTANAVSPIAK